MAPANEVLEDRAFDNSSDLSDAYAEHRAFLIENI